MSLCSLGLPHRDGTGIHAVTPASDQTANTAALLATIRLFCSMCCKYLHPLRKIVRCALQKRTDGHDDGSNENSSLTSERVANEDGEDCADEASQIVRSDSNALVGRTSGRGQVRVGARQGVDRWEVFDETGQVEKTSCHALVVTKEPAWTVSCDRIGVSITILTGNPSQQ